MYVYSMMRLYRTLYRPSSTVLATAHHTSCRNISGIHRRPLLFRYCYTKNYNFNNDNDDDDIDKQYSAVKRRNRQLRYFAASPYSSSQTSNVFGSNGHTYSNNPSNSNSSNNTIRHIRCSSSCRSSNHTVNLLQSNSHKLMQQYIRKMDPSNFDPDTFQYKDVSFDLRTGKKIVSNHSSDNANNNNDDRYTIAQCTYNDQENQYTIIWSDGVVSIYPKIWLDNTVILQNRISNNNYDDNENDIDDRDNITRISPKISHYNNVVNHHQNPDSNQIVIWSNYTETMVRESKSLCQTFDAIVNDDVGMHRAVSTLYQYGFLLVTDTPIHDNDSNHGITNNSKTSSVAVAVLAAALGGGSKKEHASSLLLQYRNRHHQYQQDVFHDSTDATVTDGPYRTLYGTIWSTSVSHQGIGTSVADSSYGNEALPLHTDMTYQRDPPGLQIFTMIQPAQYGGESIVCDGYAVATQLQRTYPKAFDVLSQSVRRYRSIDPHTGWHMEASGPIIQLDPLYQRSNNKQQSIVMIRHNDLDRLPDVPPPEDHDYYHRLQEAHDAFDTILSQDAYRLVLQLQPGDTLVVANQRCLHGRYSFTTSSDFPRIITGCYVSQDELNSRFRMMGYTVY